MHIGLKKLGISTEGFFSDWADFIKDSYKSGGIGGGIGGTLGYPIFAAIKSLVNLFFKQNTVSFDDEGDYQADWSVWKKEYQVICLHILTNCKNDPYFFKKKFKLISILQWDKYLRSCEVRYKRALSFPIRNDNESINDYLIRVNRVCGRAPQYFYPKRLMMTIYESGFLNTQAIDKLLSYSNKVYDLCDDFTEKWKKCHLNDETIKVLEDANIAECYKEYMNEHSPDDHAWDIAKMVTTHIGRGMLNGYKNNK